MGCGFCRAHARIRSQVPHEVGSRICLRRANEVKIVEIQAHINPFEDVYRKVKIFKDRAREESKNDAEHRESRLVQEFKGILDRKPD